MSNPLALGLDYGSDSARAQLVDVVTGAEVAAAVHAYPRWKKGLFCDPQRQQFRQHPKDSLDVLKRCVRDAVAAAGGNAGQRVIGIGIDTTGSTPIAVDADGTALALRDDFADDPDAMFVLWKDHTAIAEAEAINELAHNGAFTDYTTYCGGIYSSEWFWAKLTHITRRNPAVAKAAHTWVEHCDWLPAVLTETTHPDRLQRSRCAAGHKAMWHPSWGGLPDEGFLTALEPKLAGLRERLFVETVTADTPVGTLSATWARHLGLAVGIPVAAGAFDAHMGAVGAGAKAFTLAKVMGTSTCDMLMAPPDAIGATSIAGICGQVDGSIAPGMVGLEAGQSAFGDVFAWFGRQLAWPLEQVLPHSRAGADAKTRRALAADTEERLLAALGAAAMELPPGAGGEIAIDWFNGRRTPNADQRLRGAIAGLHLGSDAPSVFRALVEAAAFGAKAIVDGFEGQGVPVKKVIALGGIARKSELTMQVCADVIGRPIEVVASDQCCALGAAIFAAVAAGHFKTVSAAQRVMASKPDRRYRPRKAAVRAYAELYRRYQALGQFAEADREPVLVAGGAA